MYKFLGIHTFLRKLIEHNKLTLINCVQIKYNNRQLQEKKI